MMPFISSFEMIKVVVPEPCIFFWIPASIAEAAAVIPNGARIFFFAKGTATLSRHEQVCLSGIRFERYFSHHPENTEQTEQNTEQTGKSIFTYNCYFH